MTVRSVRAINEPGLYGDGNTLYLRVAPGGSKQWVQRLTINGSRRDIGLGGCGWVTLAEAREAAHENRRVARRGGDPLATRRPRGIPRFRDAAKQTFDALKPRWRSQKAAANWWAHLERHAFPVIGDMPVDSIERTHLLRVLAPIWTEKPESARRVRRNVRATFQWAMAHGWIEANPAGEAIDGALPAQPSVKSHLRALPYRELPAALETIEASRASSIVKLALRFLILTAARSGEIRGAAWMEIHDGLWTIPGARMKAGTEHRVPLSAPALAVLEKALAYRDESGLVFPSPIRRGRPFSDMTLTRVLRDTGLAEHATVHGFRSSFRDWCADNGKPREVAEAALAHTVGGVEGAYFRSDLFARRRRLMDSWAVYLTGTENAGSKRRRRMQRDMQNQLDF